VDTGFSTNPCLSNRSFILAAAFGLLEKGEKLSAWTVEAVKKNTIPPTSARVPSGKRDRAYLLGGGYEWEEKVRRRKLMLLLGGMSEVELGTRLSKAGEGMGGKRAGMPEGE